MRRLVVVSHRHQMRIDARQAAPLGGPPLRQSPTTSGVNDASLAEKRQDFSHAVLNVRGRRGGRRRGWIVC